MTLSIRSVIGAILYLGALSLVQNFVFAADPFTRIATGPIATNVSYTGAAWGDFNNDGFIDLFLSPYNRPNLLFSNNGNGTFSQILSGSPATDSGPTFGACWADYDNDGVLDLFVGVNSSGSDWLYHGIGGGAFTKITTGAIVSSGGNANNCSWGDYDNDGFVDLFVANSDQNDFLYHNNGNGTFTRITTNAIALKPGNSQGGTWADYDNDGRLDLFVSRVNEPNLLYHNVGGGVFTSVTNDPIVGDVVTGQGTSWGDYNNDGYLDMFVACGAKQLFYRNNGDGTFTKITTGPVATEAAGASSGCWGDYDNDGFLDLYVANRPGANFLYHNNGDGTFARMLTTILATDSAPNSFSCAWGDYDNDGFLDLVVTCAPVYNNRFYHNNGNTNHWLTVRCEGRLSNRAAIGAKVRARADIGGRQVWQLREIGGGQNLGSQDDMRPHFGLGNATNVDLLRIEWPSGLVQQLTNVAANQFLTVIEPSVVIQPALVEAPPGSSVTFRADNAANGSFAFQWTHDGIPMPGETNETLTLANIDSAAGGAYTLDVIDTFNGLSYSARPARLIGPVAISKQPLPINVLPGSNALFSVTAAGYASLAYQWQRNGLDIRDATNSTFALTNVQLASEGLYRVAVSNSYGRVFSQFALLQVLIKPVITLQPLSQSTVAGGNITFAVAATGHPLPFTFRWRRGSTFIAEPTMDSTNCFFTITNVQPTAGTNLIRYTVVVTNLAGVALSTVADVTVLADTDGDGLPDEWEDAFGLDPHEPADALRDDDLDGCSNLTEYRSGTNPRSPYSTLKLEIARQLDGTTALEFPAAANRTYLIQSRPTLDESWAPYYPLLPSVTNRTQRISIAPNSPSRLYRIVTPCLP